MTNVYLDYAAASPVSELVIGAMMPFFTDNFYNPSALYLSAQSVSRSVAEARSMVARELGCKTSEVLFVAGGTESDNLAINGVMQRFKGKNLVISAIEHPAVSKPAEQYDCKYAAVNKFGQVDIDQLVSLIDDDTVLVSVMYVNNEIGSIQPIREIAKVIKGINLKRQLKAEDNNRQALPLYLHTDACQAPNYLPVLVNSLGVDLLTLNGGKIYGPKQSGVLFVRSGIELSPQVLGGGQERNYRSGTENVPAIIGFAKALEEAAKIRESEQERLTTIRDEFISNLSKTIPEAKINGSLNHRVANNIHITFESTDNERLMMELDQAGFMVATGSACSASSDEPSEVLRAVGLSDEEARSSIRISMGRQTTSEDMQGLLKELERLCSVI